MKFLLALVILVLNSFVSCNKNSRSQPQSANVFRLDPIVVVEEPPIGTLVLDLASKLDITDLASSDY